MDKKRNALLTIGIIWAIILVFTIADLVNEERGYSDLEQRFLAVRPVFSQNALIDGQYASAYEEYAADQFVSRDRWIRIHTGLDIAQQKSEINGVYLAKDGYLMEQHGSSEYPEALVNGRVASLKKLVKKWDALVMLVPSADAVLTDKLPAYADSYDQNSLLEKVRSSVGAEQFVDVYSALKEHADEEIYYRTDPRWTSLGAYYGFRAWAGAAGKFPYRYSVDKMETVSEDFEGELRSRIDIKGKQDTIRFFPETILRPVVITYEDGTVTDRLYRESYLDTKEQYGFFPGGEHAVLEIDTGYKDSGTLFLIKDSFGDCLIPLLTTRYEKIYVVDLRYFEGKLYDLMEQCEPETRMDVLLVYNCIEFLEEFKYY